MERIIMAVIAGLIINLIFNGFVAGVRRYKGEEQKTESIVEHTIGNAGDASSQQGLWLMIGIVAILAFSCS